MTSSYVVKNAAVGLGVGAVWGVAARVWMRLITTEHPEFSWSGTLGIVIAAAVAGLAMGGVRGARLAHGSRWWRLLFVLALPLAIAPQGILAFLPAYLLGGLALAGRVAPPWRWALAAATAAMPVVFAFLVMTEVDRLGLPLPTFIAGLWILQLGQAVGGAELFRRWPPREERALPRRQPTGGLTRPGLTRA